MSAGTTRRVLIYAPGVLPTSQTFVFDQASRLTRWCGVLAGRERMDGGLPIEELVSVSMPSEISRLERTRIRLTRRVPHLRDIADRERPDLVHAHFLTGGFDVTATLARHRYPTIVTAHGFDATWYGRPPRTLRPEQWLHGALRQRLLRQPVLFLAVSTFIRDQLCRLGAPSDRVVVHHIGVDTSFYAPGDFDVHQREGILFVGRLMRQTGLHDLLEAVARLRNDGVEVPLDVVGDGPERPAAERLATKLRLDVRFHGMRDRAFVRDAMQKARVLCSPGTTGPGGDREGFGMVLVEAQASGLPVVATRSGGMVDAVDDASTGLLVGEADPVQLARALRDVLTDDDLHRRLASEARPWVAKHFDLDRQTAILEDLYDSWVEDGRARGCVALGNNHD